MKFVSGAMSLLAVSVIAVFSVRADDPPSTRDVTVQVTVLDHEDHPLEGVNVTISSLPKGRVALTDASGQATFNLKIKSDLARLVGFLTPFSGALNQNKANLERRRYEEITKNHAFRQYYIITLLPVQSEYTLEIKGAEAVKATGRLVTAGGSPTQGVISRSDGPAFLIPIAQDGAIELGGIPKGAAVQLFFSTVDTPEVKVVELSAQQTKADVQLGDVTEPPALSAPGGSALTLTMTNFDTIAWVPTPKSNFVTAITAAGDKVYTFPVNGGIAVRDRMDGGTPVLPAGTYYFVAGAMNNNRAAYSLLRVLKAGHAAEASTTGVSHVTLPGTTAMTHTLDAKAAELAIWTLSAEQ
jgi:hypothetical protein